MGTGLGIIAIVAGSVAVIKILTSGRGYLTLPGIKFSWGR